MNKPNLCPICGKTLLSVYRKIIADMPTYIFDCKCSKCGYLKITVGG